MDFFHIKKMVRVISSSILETDLPSPSEHRQFNVWILLLRRRLLQIDSQILLRRRRQHFIERPELRPWCCFSGWSPLSSPPPPRGPAAPASICLDFMPIPGRLRHASSSPRAGAPRAGAIRRSDLSDDRVNGWIFFSHQKDGLSNIEQHY